MVKLRASKLQDFQDQLRQLLDVDELFQTSELLNDNYRHTLALGFFLASQIKNIHSTNYAGPALLFTGTLEEMARASIYKINGPILDKYGKPLDQTLGTLSNSYKYMSYPWLNLIEKIVKPGKWKPPVISGKPFEFEDWVSNLEAVAKIRNTAAHSANIDSVVYQNLLVRLFGSPTKGLGVMNGLILAWHVEG